MSSSWAPAQAFAHPLFVAATALLLVNDHVLKGAGLLPPWLTGKLSDVTGLLVAPVVVAWVLRARGARGWGVAHVAVGALFTAAQLVPALSTELDRLTPWPSRLWPDPTDLVALPSLAVSFTLFGPRSAPRDRASTVAVGLFALVACAATSRSTPAPRYPYRPGGTVTADVFLRHLGNEEIAIRVERLRDGVEVDCDPLMSDPLAALGDAPFGHETRWTLARGDAVPLWDRLANAPTRACYAVRLRAQDRTWLVAWRHGAVPLRPMELRLDPDQPAEPDAVLLRPDAEPPRVPEGVVVRGL